MAALPRHGRSVRHRVAVPLETGGTIGRGGTPGAPYPPGGEQTSRGLVVNPPGAPASFVASGRLPGSIPGEGTYSKGTNGDRSGAGQGPRREMKRWGSRGPQLAGERGLWAVTTGRGAWSGTNVHAGRQGLWVSRLRNACDTGSLGGRKRGSARHASAGVVPGLMRGWSPKIKGVTVRRRATERPKLRGRGKIHYPGNVIGPLPCPPRMPLRRAGRRGVCCPVRNGAVKPLHRTCLRRRRTQ